MKTFVISDIHGQLDKFRKMIKKINFNKKDRLIILGDNVDRGELGIETVFEIMKMKDKGYDIITLKGNHESMVLECIKEFKDIWDIKSDPLYPVIKRNGTYVTMKKFFQLNEENKKRFINEIKSYKYFHIEKDILFVHAGVVPDISIENQNKEDLLWVRKDFIEYKHNLPYTIIFGHTPTRTITGENKIWHGEDKIGVDCGAAFGGHLACLEISEMKEYYI